MICDNCIHQGACINAMANCIGCESSSSCKQGVKFWLESEAENEQ